MSSRYASLPSISALLTEPCLQEHPHAVVVRAARREVAAARAAIREGEAGPFDLVSKVLARVHELRKMHLRRVINATGIVLHTNLGRAPMAPEAVDAACAVARGYSNLEMDLDSGARGKRLAGIGELLGMLSGAEAAVAVNNNAAGMLLVMTALAKGREVIISRGELVEIGGSFRVPEVISAGGARLVEVGATNRTRVSDYAAAITDDTAMILRVHPSNFRQIGFTARAERTGLVALAREHGLPLIDDLGSGLFGSLAGVDADEDAVECAIKEGADLVCFSGDKLLGGPQSGLIVGRAPLVAALRRHPLYRALRLDKMVLAALEATLRIYAEGRSERDIPVRAMLGASPAQCAEMASRIQAALPGSTIEDDLSYSGGGALPGQGLATRVVVLRGARRNQLAAALRAHTPAIVVRVARDALVIDPRTVLPNDERDLIAGLRRCIELEQQRENPVGTSDGTRSL